MKSILKKLINKETITYLIFGVLTTVVNFIAFEACDRLFEKTASVDLTLLTNVIAWVASVAFAYVTNKLFVFESKSWKGSVLIKEIPSFVGARVFSLGVESLGLLVFITWLGFDKFTLNLPLDIDIGGKLLVFINWLGFDKFTLNLPLSITIGGKLLVKIGLAVIVVIMNYVFSKLVIFKKKEKE